MSRWIDKLAYRFRGFGVDNLMLYITCSMLAVYVAQNLLPVNFYSYMMLSMWNVVFKGEIWRLVTFIFIPSQTMIIYVLLELYFYYWIGSTLENTWGRTKFTMFYLFGVIGAIVASLFQWGLGSNAYINLSLFLALATLAPNMEILLFMVLPIKIKYLAYIDLAFILYSFIRGGISTKLAVIASLINLLLFFGDDYIDWFKNWKRYGKQRLNYRKSRKRNLDMYGR